MIEQAGKKTQRPAATMRWRVGLPIVGLAFVALASCGDEATPVTVEDGFEVKTYGACGLERKGQLSLYRELPAINEGNGYVGFATEEQNATGVNKQRYSLVNCATRTVVRVASEEAVGPEGGDESTVFQRIDYLRKRSQLANEEILQSKARDFGFDVQVGRLPPRDDERAERSNCGCGRYYPGIGDG